MHHDAALIVSLIGSTLSESELIRVYQSAHHALLFLMYPRAHSAIAYITLIQMCGRAIRVASS